jgi:competence protein ComEC
MAWGRGRALAGAGAPARLLSALLRWLSACAAAERDRWALWVPVGFGAGIAGYFMAPAEPDMRILAALAVLAAAAVTVTLRLRAARAAMLMVGPAALLIGAAYAAWTAERVAAPVIDRPVYAAGLSGRVVAVEAFPDGPRVRLQALSVHRPWRVWEDPPAAVRVKLRAGAVPDVGSRIRVDARLSPPPRPSYPGAYDFARAAWFERLGGVGFALSEWQTVPVETQPGLRLRVAMAVAQLRRAVTAEIRDALAGTPGGVAAALLAGDRSGVPDDVWEDLRNSGLAHLLAISGLHIGMVAAIVFVSLRFLFALSETLSRDRPIKKWAAAGALAASFGYLLLAGATVPTQRAFLMTGLVLLAVLIDRQAISMRLVGVAAVVVLLVAPAGLMGPSFQLSFAAVVALVAVYESYRLDRRGEGEPARGRFGRIGLYLTAVALTTVVAGLATGPFAVHHFGRVAQYSVIANLAAVPIVTFFVMPAGLLSLLLMPLGLEGWPLTAAGWGIEAVLWVAAAVGDLPGSVLPVPPMPGWGFAAAVIGGLWCALWRQRWRFLGLPVLLAGVVSPVWQPVPAVVLHGDGDQAAIVWDGGLWVENQRRDRFALGVWAEKTALPIRGDWDDLAALPDSPLVCDPLGCLFTVPDRRGGVRRVAFVADPRAVREDCALADLARLPVQPHPTLCADRPAFGPADLHRGGVHAIYLTPRGTPGSGIRVETVAEIRGDRPWSR